VMEEQALAMEEQARAIEELRSLISKSNDGIAAALSPESNDISEGNLSFSVARNNESTTISIFRNFGGPSGNKIMPNDTFTLMMLTKLGSKSWVLGFFSFCFQMSLGLMIAWDQINESVGSSLFNVPFKVDNVVRVGQFLSLILCLATQSDILSSIQTIVALGKGSEWDIVIGEEGNKRVVLYLCRVFTPNLMKLMQGILVMFVSFVIIVQSDNIIDLLKDFTALMVLSETDNILFHLADLGYLGEELQKEAKRAKENDSSSVEEKSGWKYYFFRSKSLFILLLPMVIGWIIIVRNQITGTYFTDKYPKCDGHNAFEEAMEHFGNGVCYGGALNSLACAFEGGDCVNFNLAFPLCKGDKLLNVEERVGDGHCDEDFRKIECDFDGGDCCPYELMEKSYFGDGVCNGGMIGRKGCGFDNGDCSPFMRDFPDCPLEEKYSAKGSDDVIFGDGICNAGLYSFDLCGFEYGDCASGQIGQDITFNHTGLSSSDEYNDFDMKMSMDGSTVVVGFPRDDGTGSRNRSSTGLVKVLSYDPTVKLWIPMGKPIFGEKDAEPGSNKFGSKVAISTNGNRIAISDVGSFGTQGTVRIYDFIENIMEWQLFEKPILGNEYHVLGGQIDMTPDGSRIAISAELKGDAYIGRVQVFDLNPTIHQVGLDINGTIPYEQLGIAYGGTDLRIAADGRRVLVGSSTYEMLKVKIFEIDNATRRWRQLGNDIKSSFNLTSLEFSSSTLSSNGGRVAIVTNSTGVGNNHHVEVYDFNITSDEWSRIGKPITRPSSLNVGETFGTQLEMSLDGNLLIVGSSDIECLGSPRICPTGSLHLYSYLEYDAKGYESNNFQPTLSTTAGRTNVLSERENKAQDSVYGAAISLGESFLAIAGYNINDDSTFLKIMDVNDLFYLKCGVPLITAFYIGDEYCDDYPPFNTEKCNWDGGDCQIPLPVKGLPGCFAEDPGKIGDLECQRLYNYKECNYDNGDCDPDIDPVPTGGDINRSDYSEIASESKSPTPS
jgi:hypothetical protein